MERIVYGYEQNAERLKPNRYYVMRVNFFCEFLIKGRLFKKVNLVYELLFRIPNEFNSEAK